VLSFPRLYFIVIGHEHVTCTCNNRCEQRSLH